MMQFGWIVPLIVVALVAWALIALVRARIGGQDTGADAASSGPALQVLRERFARGELDEETFRRLRKELED